MENVDDTPEGQSQPDLDLMVECCFGIAAVAWAGFTVHGPGTVVLEVGDHRLGHRTAQAPHVRVTR